MMSRFQSLPMMWQQSPACRTNLEDLRESILWALDKIQAWVV